MHALFKTLALSLLLLSLAARAAYGIAGFSSVASQGQPVKEEPGWPAKVVDLINDPVRTVGWNFWSSECPNAVNHYAFAAKNTADLNRLIKVLSAAKAKGATVALALGKAGGFSFLKPGYNIPISSVPPDCRTPARLGRTVYPRRSGSRSPASRAGSMC